LANILMGVGMLGLPYIFKSAGWVGGFFVTLSFSSVAYRTSILLGRELNGDPRPTDVFDDNAKSPAVRMRKPIRSFPDIAREAFGQGGTIVLSFVLYFELFSCLCIFFVTLGDHLHTLFPMISITKHMIYASFGLAVPTALLRTPRLLSYLSAVGTFATACVVSTVAGSAIYSGDVSETVAQNRGIDMGSTPTHKLWETSGLPLAFGLIAYTFSGHAIIPSIYSSMARPQDYEKMIGFTFAGVTLCCLIVAVSGYYMFGNLVDDQITLSLERYSGPDNIIMKVVTWLMILTAFSKFTLTAFPLALGLEEIVAPVIPNDRVMEFVSSLIKLLLIGSSLAVAIFVPSFSILCSLVGLICTMIVSVIFPAAAHLKMFGSHISLWEKLLDWLFILAGLFMAVIGTIQSLD
jgi:vesicular inhibitory amino acid transporter